MRIIRNPNKCVPKGFYDHFLKFHTVQTAARTLQAALHLAILNIFK